MKPAAGFLLLALAPFFQTSCAGPDFYLKVNGYSEAGNYAAALRLIEKNKKEMYPGRDALLYYLDTGILNHLAGHFGASNAAFEKAKRLSESYFTKSVTQEASTSLINDAHRPYYGEDLERALIYLFKALNYAALNKNEDALVEARQFNDFLKASETAKGGGNLFSLEAFIHYFMGLVWESSGKLNDALIEYKKSISLYEKTSSPPRGLIVSAIAIMKKLGLSSDEAWYSKKYSVYKIAAPEKTEIVVVHLNGPAPKKISRTFELAFSRGWAYANSARTEGNDDKNLQAACSAARGFASDKMFKISFPEYKQPQFSCAGLNITCDSGTPEGKTSAGCDISSIAEKNLKDRINRIRVKSIVRTWTKYVLAKKTEAAVKKSHGALAGMLAGGTMRAFASATEEADTRSWRTLPAKIGIARIPVKPGIHTLGIEMKNAAGNVIGEKTIDGIKAAKNGKTFVSVRTYR